MQRGEVKQGLKSSLTQNPYSVLTIGLHCLYICIFLAHKPCTLCSVLPPPVTPVPDSPIPTLISCFT